MKFYYSPKEQWEIIKPIWRIMVVIIIFQIVFGALAIAIGHYGNPFIDFWFGGAVSTLPGFIVGAIWHNHFVTEHLKNNLFALLFIGSISLFLTIFAYIFPLEEVATQLNNNIL
ncbi:MAG: hypothetical protein ABFS08_11490 [Pseudomonadota bacterium]